MIYRNRSAIKAQGSNSVEWAKEAGKSAIETGKSDAKKTKEWIKDGFKESDPPDWKFGLLTSALLPKADIQSDPKFGQFFFVFLK